MNVQARAGQNWVVDDGHWSEGRRGDVRHAPLEVDPSLARIVGEHVGGKLAHGPRAVALTGRTRAVSVVEIVVEIVVGDAAHRPSPVSSITPSANATRRSRERVGSAERSRT